MNRRFLSGSWLALVLACGGSKSTAPGAPNHVAATAGDGVVQVEWSAVAGATSYAVYSDVAVSKSSPKVVTGATGAEIHGLTNGVAYQFAVTASNSAGESALSAVVTATPQAPPPALTATVTPADGASGVSRNPQIQVVFGRAVDASTVSAITSGTACGSSTVQLSADGFASCIAVASRAATAGDTTFTFGLAAPLAGSATYQLRLTVGIKDSAGVGLAHSTTASFTTAASLAVAGFAPSGTGVAPLPALSVTFNRDADARSITAQAGAGACQGSLQLSSDGFTNCVAMAAQPSTSDNRTFLVTPAAELALGTAYVLRVKATVRDSDGVELGADSDGAPFTTIAPLTLLDTTPHEGATGVPLRGPIVLTFNRAVDLATIGDGPGCTGTVRIASAGLCNVGAVTANAAGDVVTVTPPADLAALAPDAQYTITVTAGVKDAAGFALSNPLAQATGFHTRLPTTLAFSPANGAGPVPIDTPIVLAFSRPVTGVTTNATSSCTGATVVVTNGATCVPIDHATVNGGTWTLFPAGYLPANATLNVSVAGASILDAEDGVHFQGDTSEPAGFTTGDVLRIDASSPADGDSAVARNASVSVTFNRAPLLSTLTASTDTHCDKALQLSTDPDFADGTCVPMAAAAPLDVSPGTFQYRWTPKDPLAGSTTFYLRVVAGVVTDADGVSIAHDFIMSSGFTTSAEMKVDPALTTSGSGLTPDTQPVVAFTRAPLASTISGDCATGTITLTDATGHCLLVQVEPIDAVTWQIIPDEGPLLGGMDYTIKVTTAVTDSDGTPLAATFTQTFHTRPALSVIATMPADGAADQPLTVSPIVVQFSRDVGAEAFDSDVSCTGTFEISADGFASCVALQSAPSVGATPDTVKLVPAAPLLADKQYLIRVRKNFTDVDGFGMDFDYTSATGFHTRLPVAMTVSPGDGASGVAANAPITLTFSRPVEVASLTPPASDCTGGGTLLVSAAAFTSCMSISALDPASGSTAVVTVTLGQTMPSSSLIQVRIKANALDADGAPLSGDLTSAGFHTAPTADVTGLAAEPATLQSIPLTWTATDPSFDHAHIYASLAGQNDFNEITDSGSIGGGTAFGLLPLTAYDLRVTADDGYGHESPGVQLNGVSTAFTATTDDWNGNQTLSGLNGDRYRLSWNSTDLVAGVSKSDGTSLLNDGDELWIAVDTDAAGSDTHGEAKTVSTGANDVIWPFKADYVVALTQVGAGSTSIGLHTAGVDGFAALATDSYEGAVDEVRVPGAAIGSPAQARFAFAVVQTGDGLVRSIAPLNASATDVTGFFGSLTSGIDASTHVFNTGMFASSISTSTASPAASLVTLSVDSAANPVTRVNGSLHPLSYTATDVSYTLANSGTVYTGIFNFGGSTEELFFQFVGGADGATPEFASGSDRVYTLTGVANPAVPQVTYGTALNGPCKLTFVPSAGTQVQGSASPLAWDGTGNSGQPLSTQLSFANCGFISTSLEFKAFGGLPCSGYECSSNHLMNDDVLNSRTLAWTAGVDKSF